MYPAGAVPVKVLRPTGPGAYVVAYVTAAGIRPGVSRGVVDQADVDVPVGRDVLEFPAFDPNIRPGWRLEIQGAHYDVVGTRPVPPLGVAGLVFAEPVSTAPAVSFHGNRFTIGGDPAQDYAGGDVVTVAGHSILIGRS